MAPKETPTPMPAAAPGDRPADDGDDVGLELVVADPPVAAGVTDPVPVPVVVATAVDVAVLIDVVACELSASIPTQLSFPTQTAYICGVDCGIRAVVYRLGTCHDPVLSRLACRNSRFAFNVA